MAQTPAGYGYPPQQQYYPSQQQQTSTNVVVVQQPAVSKLRVGVREIGSLALSQECRKGAGNTGE